MEDITVKLKSDFNVLRTIIEEEIPYSRSLLNEKKWNQIKEKYSSKVEQVLEHRQLNSYCIIDFIIGIKHPNCKFANQCRSMICAINNEINKASIFIGSNPAHKNAINNIITNMLSSMDTDIQSNNSDFKNWVNELFVFNKLTTCTAYTLIEMERKLSSYDSSNKKSVDYAFKCEQTHEELLLDVVTLQKVDPSKHKTNKSFNEFVNQRIQKKYDSKLGESTNISIFRVLPILEYQDGMEKFTIKINKDISLPILTICRNKVNDREEIGLMEINSFLTQVRKQKR